MTGNKTVPHIQVCGLEAAIEADIEAYDGVITIENSTIQNPFRIDTVNPPQRIIVFDDIIEPMDNYVLLEEWQVRSALAFAHRWVQPSLLIHCHAGMSRSPAIALAIFADWLGEGCEEEAVRELLKIAPLCTPNRLVVEIADKALFRGNQILDAWRRVAGSHLEVGAFYRERESNVGT